MKMFFRRIFLCALLFLVMAGLSCHSEVNADTLINVEPSSATDDRAVNFTAQQKDFEVAIEKFEADLIVNPSDELRQTYFDKIYKYALFLNANRKYYEALFYLQRIETDYIKGGIRDEVCNAYIGVMTDKVKEKAYDEILKALESSQLFFEKTSIAGKLGMVLYNGGVQAFNDLNYKAANDLLLKSIAYRENNVHVYQLLGEISRQTNDLKKAREYFQRALQESEIENKEKNIILNKLNELNSELAAADPTEGLKKIGIPNFDLYCVDELSRDISYDLKKMLREVYRNICREFNYYPRNKIPVILYAVHDFNAQTEGKHAGIRAIYDGRIRMPVFKRDNFNTKKYESLLTHEFVHAIVHQLGGGKVPLWFTEGLAHYYEKKIYDAEGPMQLYCTDFNEASFLKQDSVKSDDSSDEDCDRYYAKARAIIKELSEGTRKYKLKMYMQYIKKGYSPEKALKSVYYMTYDELLKKMYEKYKR